MRREERRREQNDARPTYRVQPCPYVDDSGAGCAMGTCLACPAATWVEEPPTDAQEAEADAREDFDRFCRELNDLLSQDARPLATVDYALTACTVRRRTLQMVLF